MFRPCLAALFMFGIIGTKDARKEWPKTAGQTSYMTLARGAEDAWS